jgi:hypothetical protein
VAFGSQPSSQVFMRWWQHRTVWLLAGALTVGARSALSRPDRVAEPALLIHFRDTTRIVASDTIARGQVFEVRFFTFGGGCTGQVARTDVQVAPGVVEVRPYNWRHEADVCWRDILGLEHRAEVQVAEAWVATLRVLGEQEGPSTGNNRSVPAELTRRLVVR